MASKDGKTPTFKKAMACSRVVLVKLTKLVIASSVGSEAMFQFFPREIVTQSASMIVKEKANERWMLRLGGDGETSVASELPHHMTPSVILFRRFVLPGDPCYMSPPPTPNPSVLWAQNNIICVSSFCRSWEISFNRGSSCLPIFKYWTRPCSQWIYIQRPQCFFHMIQCHFSGLYIDILFMVKSRKYTMVPKYHVTTLCESQGNRV